MKKKTKEAVTLWVMEGILAVAIEVVMVVAGLTLDALTGLRLQITQLEVKLAR